MVGLVTRTWRMVAGVTRAGGGVGYDETVGGAAIVACYPEPIGRFG
jgi:hypothetical protein